jgi:hypothetical protein
LHRRQIDQGTPQPWSGPAKGRDRVVAEAKLPSVSSSPVMELRVIGGPTRGTPQPWHGPDRGQLRTCQGGAMGRPLASGHGGLPRSLWRTILRRCYGERSREWSSGLRLEASGQKDKSIGLLGWCRDPRAQPSCRSDALIRPLSFFEKLSRD